MVTKLAEGQSATTGYAKGQSSVGSGERAMVEKCENRYVFCAYICCIGMR